jgi:tricarballylate dehydrogenase
MSAPLQNLVVVGQGAAGLAAALTAAETARANGWPIKVTLADKAAEAEAGGNTRWSPSNMRMASPERVESSFVRDMLDATQSRGDERYFARLAEEAPATIKWLASLGIQFVQPSYYLAKGPPRIQPVWLFFMNARQKRSPAITAGSPACSSSRTARAGHCRRTQSCWPAAASKAISK